MRKPSILFYLALAAQVSPLTAQQPTRDEECKTVALAGVKVTGCNALATVIMDRLTAPFYQTAAVQETIAPRDVQPADPGDAALAGSLAQGEAVPDVRPIPLAGGTIAAVGNNAGARAITAIALNPATLFGNTNDPRSAARASRLADISFLLPVDELDADDDGRIDYVGFRARLNVTGVSAGSKLFTDVTAAAKQATISERDLRLKIRKTLENAPSESLGDCVKAILKARPGETLGSACGDPVSFDTDPTSHAKLKDRVRALREEADRSYFGMELRFDQGDPTLGADSLADGTSFLAGLAWGRRFSNPLPAAALSFKARLGARYVDLRDTSVTKLGIDGGLGFEVTRVLEDQRVKLGAGLEFAYGNADRELREALQTDFVVFRASLSVPLVNTTTTTITVTAPIYGEQSSSLSIGGNWSLLLPATPPAGRRDQ